MTEQNLQRLFWGLLSLPSPQIASILIKNNFHLYQYFSLTQIMTFKQQQQDSSFVTPNIYLCI